jgi:2-polyprenyl-3-methyl-5-hydroxy-6-metoxy-1,4-benzoquinol methylase
MLNIAKQNAKKRNIDNINFQIQDITKLSLDKKYDVITCSYALFFLPDAAGILKNLVGLLKNDGIVIFTTFLEKAFSPSVDIFLSLLKKYGSSTALEYNPNTWDKLKREKDIKQLCKKASITKIEIDTKEIRYALSLDAWWELWNNTGFKGMLMELSFENYKLVKSEYNQAMSKYTDIDANVELVADTFFVRVGA